ncbi:MAG: helix-turn-helix domain-containing protein [Candidatus Aminicenantes bacterium]|nr:helix-turn-helix domain-containing protein [Candidatus Aminicenantes bacterium]
MEIGVRDILHFFTAFLLLFFSFFLLSLKKGKRLSNIILAVFLLSKALGIINYIISRSEIENPHIYFILLPFAFLYGPSIYFYTRSLAYRNFVFKKVHGLHLIPFFSVGIYFTVIYHAQSTATKVEILTNLRESFPLQAIIIISLLHMLIFGYLSASFHILMNYRRRLKSFFSCTEKINLYWLNYVLVGYSVIWAIDVSSFILGRLSIPTTSLDTLTFVLIFVFANIIVFKGLKQPEIFNGIEEKQKYRHSRLTQPDKDLHLKQLQSHMLERKPYLNPSLTINELSRNISISPRDLSQIINESLGTNFFDFVNSYRIEEAKLLLTDSSNHNKNILEILLDAGFNTKSVFNRVFKKHTGTTPSEFRKTPQR